MTFTEREHDAPAARPAPLRVMMALPVSPVTEPALQLLLRPLGDATTTPVGSGSVKPIAVRIVGLLLVIANVRVDRPPTRTVSGKKLFVKDALLRAPTTRFAFAGRLVPASVELTVTVFAFVPALVAITLTVIVQVAFGPRNPLARLIVLLPAVAVRGPAQPLVTAGVGATTRPEASVSVKARPVISVPLGLKIVIVRVDV